MSKTQSTSETEVVKFPDFVKMQAETTKLMGDFAKGFANGKSPMVDFEALFAAGRRNFETLTEANRLAFEGVKAIAQRQTEIARKAVEDFGKATKDFGQVGSAEEKFASQTEATKVGFEQVVANIREIANLVQKANTEVADLISRRVSDQLDEVTAALSKTAKH
jgi:phasin family protein